MQNGGRSALLTSGLVQKAMEIIAPSIENLIRIDPTRKVIFIVVLDPVAAAENRWEPLWQGAIGEQDQSKWARPYNEFAVKKTQVTLRTRMPSHVVQHDLAHLYAKGDFKYGGSEYRNGIVVGASGLAWHLDYAASSMTAGLLDAMVKGAFEIEYAKKDAHFIGIEATLPK